MQAASHNRGPWAVPSPAALADARIVSTMPRMPYDQLTIAPSRVQTAPGTHFVSELMLGAGASCG